MNFFNNALTQASAAYTSVEKYTQEQAIPQTVAAYSAVEKLAQPHIAQTASQTAALASDAAAKVSAAYSMVEQNARPRISQTVTQTAALGGAVYGTARQFARDNPRTSTAISIGVGGAVAPMLVVPFLGLVGFSAGGVVAGSVAAGIQSTLGSVGAGGLFAFCQSAAMGGYGAAALSAVGVTSGVFAGTTAAAAATVATARQRALGNNADISNSDSDGGDADDTIRGDGPGGGDPNNTADDGEHFDQEKAKAHDFEPRALVETEFAVESLEESGSDSELDDYTPEGSDDGDYGSDRGIQTRNEMGSTVLLNVKL